jgi:hypothetical protein
VEQGASALPAADFTEHYERMRTNVVARNGSGGLRLGQGLLMARGMAAWVRAAAELIPPARSVPLARSETVSVPLPIESEVIQLIGGAVMALVAKGSSL